MKAVNIEWDVDCTEDAEMLPKEIEIPEGMKDVDDISDYISDLTGFCHKGYSLVEKEADIQDASFEKLNLHTWLSSLVDPNRFTKTTNAMLCFDSIDGHEVVCVDLCYDSSETLPACDVVNIFEKTATLENIQIARDILKQLADIYLIPVQEEVSNHVKQTKPSLDEQIQCASNRPAAVLPTDRAPAKESTIDH